MQKLAEINWSDFIKGEGQADLIPSGGFSPRSYGLNLTKERGKAYFIEAETDRGGATLTDDAIAFAYDKTLSGNDLYILDDGGAVYTLAGDSTLTKRQTITADTFVRGTSDLLQYSPAVATSYTFATSLSRIIRFTGSNLDGAAPDTDFWTGLSTGCRHPMERVEDKIYFGDMNLVHSYDGTTTTSAFVTLPPDVNITSLRKHPDGRTLLAFCGTSQNFSHTRGGGGRVYFIDPSLKDWTREVEIESQVEGTRVVGGVIYVTYGTNLGYFDGSGLKFLKKLAVATTDTTTGNAIYSHQITSIEDTLVVASDYDTLFYGDLGAGNVFWKGLRTSGNRTLTAIVYRGDNKILHAYQESGGTEKLTEIDYDNIGVNGTFLTNHFFWNTNASVKKIDVLHDVTNSSGTSRFQIEVRKHSGGTTSVIEDRTYTSQSTNKSTFNTDIKMDVFQLYLVPTTDDIGITSIRIYGDPIV